MLIWFAVASAVLVALVFQSPGIDYRWVMAGAVLPVAEAALGGPRVLHSLLGPVVLLTVTVAATQRRRLLRRRVLGLPIGMMAHLVLDGSFTQTDSFWWPFSGTAFASGQVPEVDHLVLSLVLEAVGVAVAIWAFQQFGLADRATRTRFLREGRLDPPAPAGRGRAARRPGRP